MFVNNFYLVIRMHVALPFITLQFVLAGHNTTAHDLGGSPKGKLFANETNVIAIESVDPLFMLGVGTIV